MVDSTAVLNHIERDAFGQVISQSNPAFASNRGFQGLYSDADVNVVFADNRVLDLVTGRWLQQDPIMFRAGDANLYRMVGNNVTNATDPSGLYDIVFALYNEARLDRATKQAYAKLANDFIKWYEKEKADMSWLDDVPIPPSQLHFENYKVPFKDGYRIDRRVRIPAGWEPASPWAMRWPLYCHPNATFGIRTIKPTKTGAGAQAMYDANGKLITSGLSAGTADKVSPANPNASHQSADYLPFVQARNLDNYYGGRKYRDLYIEVRPPRTGDAPNNIVD